MGIWGRNEGSTLSNTGESRAELSTWKVTYSLHGLFGLYLNQMKTLGEDI